MSAPVDHLQERLCDARETLTDIMAPAITLAVMLHHQDMAAWLRCELEGYAPETEPPGYRHNVSGLIVARSSQYGWIPAPVDKHQMAQFGHINLCEGVAELEKNCMNSKKGDGHRITLAPAQLKDLQQKINLSAELAISISRSTYCDLIRTVRGALYLWVTAIIDAGLNGDHSSFSKEEQEQLTSLDQPVRFWREAMVSLHKLPVPAVREAGFLERMFGRAS